jgi:hypothetical protein
MSAAATQNVTHPLITDDIDAGQPDFQSTLVIDRFDHWHNQPCSLLRPTSITWSDPATTVGRDA